MEFVPRFGHHVIPKSQINISEVDSSDRFLRDVQKAKRLHLLWYPIIVEVIEEDREYVLVDGLRRFDMWVNRLKWGIVECIVMPESSHKERQLRRFGMNTLSKSYSCYDTHCALYGMRKSGISDRDIIERSGMSASTIQKYLNNLYLPLDFVLEGQRWRVAYEGWIKVLSIPLDYVPKDSQQLIRDLYLDGQCYAYQVDDIISAAATSGFQVLSHEEKAQVLRKMCLETQNVEISMKPTAAELFGFTVPEANKVFRYAQSALSTVERLLQPEVLRNMLPSQRQGVQQSAYSILNTFELFDGAYEDKGEQPQDPLFQ